MGCRGKEFRTDFARVGALREYLPGVPFGACTATASPEKMRSIRAGLSISKDSISVICPTNRPNLFYGVKQIEGSGLGGGDLEFLLPKSTSSPDFDVNMIPKTIIYIDHKQSALGLAGSLRGNLSKSLQQRPPRPKLWDADPRSPAEKIVAIYHDDVSDTMKRYISEDWNNGHIRIMIASSAWGMGINDRGVERVIQWSISHLDNLDTLMQRFGRCAHNA